MTLQRLQCRRLPSVLRRRRPTSSAEANKPRERSSLANVTLLSGNAPRIRKRSNPAVGRIRGIQADRSRSLASRPIFSLLSDLLPWDRASPWGRVYATCARNYVSHGYIVVSPRILIKPGRGGPPEERAGAAASSGSGSGSSGGGSGSSNCSGSDRSGSNDNGSDGSNGSNGYRGPPPADVCERYRYLRKGICVELAYNRRARSAHTESRGPRLHVSRELYSLREHNI